MAVENLLHNDAGYAIALERRDYRRACWIAAGAMRRYGRTGLWLTRFRGSLARRERRKEMGKVIAEQKVAIGYDEPADPDNPEGPKLVVTYEAGAEILGDVVNLEGLVDQGYVRVEED